LGSENQFFPMKMRIPFLLLLSLVINLDAAPARKAAAAKANITPKKNLWMAGYFNYVMGYILNLRALYYGDIRYIHGMPHLAFCAETVERRLMDRIYSINR